MRTLLDCKIYLYTRCYKTSPDVNNALSPLSILLQTFVQHPYWARTFRYESQTRLAHHQTYVRTSQTPPYSRSISSRTPSYSRRTFSIVSVATSYRFRPKKSRLSLLHLFFCGVNVRQNCKTVVIPQSRHTLQHMEFTFARKIKLLVVPTGVVFTFIINQINNISSKIKKVLRAAACSPTRISASFRLFFSTCIVDGGNANPWSLNTRNSLFCKSDLLSRNIQIVVSSSRIHGRHPIYKFSIQLN